MKRLEVLLGMHFLNRTDRSVTLTAAGEEFRCAIGQPSRTVAQAVQALSLARADKSRASPVILTNDPMEQAMLTPADSSCLLGIGQICTRKNEGLVDQIVLHGRQPLTQGSWRQGAAAGRSISHKAY
jgi:hypothetical protein